MTDIFLPNEPEALRISGCSSLTLAIENLRARGIRHLVIKRGKYGAQVVTEQQQFTTSLPPVTGGDSIGAGDSFDAGFLAGWLRGLPLDECLQIASQCGRQVAAQTGGLAGQPDWETIQKLLKA